LLRSIYKTARRLVNQSLGTEAVSSSENRETEAPGSADLTPAFPELRWDVPAWKKLSAWLGRGQASYNHYLTQFDYL